MEPGKYLVGKRNAKYQITMMRNTRLKSMILIKHHLVLGILISFLGYSCEETNGPLFDSIDGPPRIDSLSVLSGFPGDVVTLYGANFSDLETDNIVYFGGEPAEVRVSILEEMQVVVPGDAASGPVTIKVSESELAIGPEFTVYSLPPPAQFVHLAQDNSRVLELVVLDENNHLERKETLVAVPEGYVIEQFTFSQSERVFYLLSYYDSDEGYQRMITRFDPSSKVSDTLYSYKNEPFLEYNFGRAYWSEWILNEDEGVIYSRFTTDSLLVIPTSHNEPISTIAGFSGPLPRAYFNGYLYFGYRRVATLGLTSMERLTGSEVLFVSDDFVQGFSGTIQEVLPDVNKVLIYGSKNSSTPGVLKDYHMYMANLDGTEEPDLVIPDYSDYYISARLGSFKYDRVNSELYWPALQAVGNTDIWLMRWNPSDIEIPPKVVDTHPGGHILTGRSPENIIIVYDL